MDNIKIDRMRERARQMRRAAAMSHNSEIIQILSMAADEAEADAAEMELELRRQIQDLPPQS
jgi:DNA-directed RNA polymerase specialized sigma24 family protein